MLDSEVRTDAERQFHEATEQLYAVFGRYPKPPVEQCCDALDHITPEMHATWEMPLRAYTTEALDYLARHSFCGVFSNHEDLSVILRHWLPRLLEEWSKGAYCGYVTEDWFLAEKLTQARWHAWPTQEESTIRAWFAKWFAVCLTRDKGCQVRRADEGDFQFNCLPSAVDCCFLLLGSAWT